MDNQKSPYGQILLQLLGQLMKGTSPQNTSSKPQPAAEPAGVQGGIFGEIFFARDETGCRWRREERVELLAEFCREGYAMAKKHGHFLVGTGEKGSFLAIPGRFLLAEQPAGGVTGFTFWQPLAGGEELYDSLDNMAEAAAETVYGYWIARLDADTLKISEV